MEMEMSHILSVCDSVRNDNLSFRVKSREGGCSTSEREQRHKATAACPGQQSAPGLQAWDG